MSESKRGKSPLPVLNEASLVGYFIFREANLFGSLFQGE